MLSGCRQGFEGTQSLPDKFGEQPELPQLVDDIRLAVEHPSAEGSAGPVTPVTPPPRSAITEALGAPQVRDHRHRAQGRAAIYGRAGVAPAGNAGSKRSTAALATAASCRALGIKVTAARG